MKFLAVILVVSMFGQYSCEPDCTINGTKVDGCPTSCPETCSSKNYFCTKDCGGPCVCKQGYIIDTRRPACVLIVDCPADAIQSPKPTEIVGNFPYFGKSYGATTFDAILGGPGRA